MRTVVFCSDYGLDDPFVGLCHATLQRHAPGVVVVDLTHAVARHDVAAGALMLADCLPWLPSDAVVLAVVDPGVGSARRGVAVAAGEAHLIGPDNGLLWPAVEALGGPGSAVRLADEGVPPTFHGRDVFAPAAAALAAGAAVTTLGEALDPAGLVTLRLRAARAGAGLVDTEVVAVDRYGNLALSARRADLDRAGLTDRVGVVAAGREVTVPRARTFADVAPGRLVLLVDAFDRAALAVNTGDAAARLGLARGAAVVLRAPAPG